MATRLRRVQYHLVVHDPDSNGGPGRELFELTGEALNLVWQSVLNLPGNAAFTLMRNSRKLGRLEYMRHYLKIWREDDRGTVNVGCYKIVQADHGPRDSIIFCWDYLALYQRVIVEYYLNTAKKRYAAKYIGDVIADAGSTMGSKDLFELAKSKTKSPVEFITKGTVQRPTKEDGSTPIKTGTTFGIANLQDTLKVFYDLAEMSMANTTKTVAFEVAPDDRTDQSNPAQKFNLWKNRTQNVNDYAFTFPGTLADWGYTESWGSVLNKMYTLLRDGNSVKLKPYSVETDPTDATGRNNIRLLEGTGQVSTLVGITQDTDDLSGQKLAIKRQARQARRVQRTLVVYPREGYITPYYTPNGGSWRLGDDFYVNLRGTGVDPTSDQMAKWLKCHSMAAAWSAEAGESLQLFLRQSEAQ